MRNNSIKNPCSLTPSGCLDAALYYLRKGFSVIPIEPHGKRPLGPWAELQERHFTEAEVHAWWREHPNANVAIITGIASGIFVLDADGREGEKQIRNRSGVPITLISRTAKGRHYIFKHPGLKVPNAVRLAEGLDIRGDGGYFVAPPSIHPSGHQYFWEISPEEADPVPAPEWLLHMLRRHAEPQASPTERPPDWVAELLGGVEQGCRDDAAIRLAGYFIAKGVAATSVEKILLLWNQKNRPPMGQSPSDMAAEEWVRVKVASAMRMHREGNRAIGEERGAPKDNQRKSQADILVKLADSAFLFHDGVQEPYARFTIGEHHEVWRCRSKQFKRWLAGRFWEQQGKAPNTDAINSALNVIEGKACFEGPERRLHNRVSFHEGALWYDLTDERWRAVRVTRDGWQVVDNPPILFRRYAHQAAQVEPVPRGDPRDFLKYVTLREEADKLLLLVHLISSYIPDIPHPIPQLHGPSGSAKTTLFRLLRRLLDPSAVEVLTLPTDKNDFVQMLSHHWAAYFDNVTYLSDWVSDALCRACTGEGFSKRELYSDDEDVIYAFRRCVGLNGINVAAAKPDLFDRVILFGLERIPPGERREERELWSHFEQARPHILGGIFDTLVKVLSILPYINHAALPRMADFARWGCAIARALGYPETHFLTAYGANIRTQNEEAVQSNPVAAAILALTEDRDRWQGTASALLEKLEAVAEEQKISTKSKGWPKAAHVLTRRLREVKTNLADIGIELDIQHTQSGSIVAIQKSAQESVSTVSSISGATKATDSGAISVGSRALQPEANSVRVQIASRIGEHSQIGNDAPDASDGIFSSLTASRSQLLELGGGLGWPELPFAPGRSVVAGQVAWAAFIRAASPDDIALAVAAGRAQIEALMGPDPWDDGGDADD